MPFLEVNNLEPRQMLPGCIARFVHADNMTISYWDLEPGAVIPNHSHPHEQVSSVIRGELELTVGGETRLLGPGGVAIVGSNVEHSVNALSECYVIDAFYPVREDYR